jgi:hypothetical protein
VALEFLTRPGARVVVVVQSSTEHNALRETSEKLRLMFESLAIQVLRCRRLDALSKATA